MDLSYQDSSDEDSNMIIVRDDDPTEAGPTSGPLVATLARTVHLSSSVLVV